MSVFWLVVFALGCEAVKVAGLPADPSEETAAPSEETAAPEVEDTAPPPEITCEEPALELVGEWRGSDLHPEPIHGPATVLGSCGWGLAAVDLNGDGAVDLLPAGAGSPTFALLNVDGVLTASRDVRFDDSELPPGNGLAAGDINQDGRPDIVLVRSRGFADLVYINQGGGIFSSVELPASSTESQGATLFDADGDGDLDLFISRHIDMMMTDVVALEARTQRGDPNGFYINEGGTFVVGPPVGVIDAATFQAVPMDVDVDGDLDLFLVNDFGAFIEPSALMMNDGTGHFIEADDCGCDQAMFGMGATASDANNDGLVDLYLSDFGSPQLLLGLGMGSFYDSTLASGAGVVPSADRVTSWGTTFIDLDQDGSDEVATAFGPVMMGVPGDWSDMVTDSSVEGLDDSQTQRDALWLNQDGHFEEASESLGFDFGTNSRAVVTADFDGDGLPDLATSGLDDDRQQVVRMHRSSGGCGPGVTVEFPAMGAADIGATVEWSVAGVQRVRWYLPTTTFSSSGPTLHLGLGGHEAADWVRITPVNGATRETRDVSAGSTVF
jgi:hypothetical protein